MHRSANALVPLARQFAPQSALARRPTNSFYHQTVAFCSTTGGSSDGGDLPPGGSKASSTRSLGNCKDCGKPLKPAPTLTPSTRYIHCDSCNKLYIGNLAEDSSKQWNLKSEQRRSPPYPSQIADYLDRFVVGQKQAKKTLAVGVYQHYRRLEHNIETGAHSAYGNGPQSQENKVPRGVLYQEELRPNSMMPNEFRTGNMPPGVFSQHLANTTGGMQHQQQSPPARRAPPVFRAIPEKEPSVRLEKSNVLLVGPSGVGKTFLTQTLARVLDVPIALCDCTSMTQAGYVGEDVESVIQKLVQAAGGNPERAQQGIVFLDEVDKVEGSVVNVKSGRKGVGAQQDTVQVDTSDILFIASGAFTSLDKIVGRRLDKKSLGYGSSSGEIRVSTDDSNSEAARKRDALLGKADQGDLINFGMVPELVGRFPVIVPFHSFDQDMLVRVLTEPQNSLLAQLKLQFAIDNVDLSFSSEALMEVAKQALERKTGARALRSILEMALLDAKFVVPGSDIEGIHVTREAVKGEGSVEMHRRQMQQAAAAAL